MKKPATEPRKIRSLALPPRASNAAVDPRLFLTSVEKTFRVLESFSGQTQPLLMSQIVKLSGMDKSAVQRTCHTLTYLGYLERDPGGRGWIPGKRCLDLSFDFLRYSPVVRSAMPIMSDLRRTTSARVDLSLHDDLTIVYAIRLQSKRENFPATLIGRRIPTFISSGGRAVMSKLPDDEVNSILERSDRVPVTTKSITGIPEIWGKIHEAREKGYALAVEEALLGEVVLAAAISDANKRPVGAVHIAGSLSDWTVEEFVEKMHPLAIEAAHALRDL